MSVGLQELALLAPAEVLFAEVRGVHGEREEEEEAKSAKWVLSYMQHLVVAGFVLGALFVGTTGF